MIIYTTICILFNLHIWLVSYCICAFSFQLYWMKIEILFIIFIFVVKHTWHTQISIKFRYNIHDSAKCSWGINCVKRSSRHKSLWHFMLRMMFTFLGWTKGNSKLLSMFSSLLLSSSYNNFNKLITILWERQKFWAC